MTDIKFTLSEDILKRMRKFPEIDWNKIAYTAIEDYIRKLEHLENEKELSELTKLSEEPLSKFLENEADLYTDNDLRLKYQ